jgi:membrane-associated HD superfamily phosphohydrolase
MKPRNLAIIAGVSYLIIFFAAIFANFFVLESILKSPVETVKHNPLLVRFGILAFLITVVFDVIVAWALYELYKTHPLSGLSTYFRMMHAAIMGVAIFALPLALTSITQEEILLQVDIFNTIWLIGLFFFGVHLILLGRIIKKPGIIAFFLIVAGIMYMIDTAAHFLLTDYETYGSIFLALVAIPSIIGEMSFAIWLLIKGGKSSTEI